MVITEEEAKLRREVRLDYQYYKRATGWDDLVIEDTLNKTNQIATVVEEVGSLSTQVAINTQTNIDQQAEIDSNTLGVINNALGIAQNSTDISANTSLINGHINNISGAHAATAISFDNTASGYTATNTQAAIDEGASDLDAHEALASAHGVTGNNVGTEDYAQTAIGGVVLLADLVANVSATTTAIATADVGAAPATYDQTYADQQTALINECKAKINSLINNDVLDLITQFNDLLQQMKDAKQMNTV